MGTEAMLGAAGAKSMCIALSNSCGSSGAAARPNLSRPDRIPVFPISRQPSNGSLRAARVNVKNISLATAHAVGGTIGVVQPMNIANARSMAVIRRLRDGLRSIVLAVILSAVAIAACDPTGSSVIVLNQSDSDVVVLVNAGGPTGSKNVPAHTQGTVFNTFGSPGQGAQWTVVVFDDACERLIEFPIQTNGSAIHIDPNGNVTFEPGDPTFAVGLDVVTLDDASCP